MGVHSPILGPPPELRWDPGKSRDTFQEHVILSNGGYSQRCLQSRAAVAPGRRMVPLPSVLPRRQQSRPTPDSTPNYCSRTGYIHYTTYCSMGAWNRARALAAAFASHALDMWMRTGISTRPWRPRLAQHSLCLPSTNCTDQQLVRAWNWASYPPIIRLQYYMLACFYWIFCSIYFCFCCWCWNAHTYGTRPFFFSSRILCCSCNSIPRESKIVDFRNPGYFTHIIYSWSQKQDSFYTWDNPAVW